MNRPLAAVGLVYAAGVLLADWLAAPLIWLFGVSLTLAWLAVFWGRARPALLWPMVFFAGWTNLTSRTEILSPYDLRVVLGEGSQLAGVRGVLITPPTLRIFERDGEETWRTTAQVEVLESRQNDVWRPAFGQIAVTTGEPLGPRFFAGQSVEIHGAIERPKGPMAEGLRDDQSTLRHQRIYYRLHAKTADLWSVWKRPGESPRPPLAQRFCTWAQATLARGLPFEDEPLRLLWAMALGWQTGLTNLVAEPFMRTGTMHIFAISGLHIALIAGILLNLLRALRLPRGACGWLVAPTIWFYTAATGWQSSAIRSTIMMTIIVGGWTLNRPSNLLNSLSAAGLTILLWQPEQLFQASFQLSFFVVLAVGLLLPPLEEWRRRWFQPDPLLPQSLRPRWRRGLDALAAWSAGSVAVSVAAFLGSLPLVAYYFNLLTPISLAANLVVVPLSTLALICNLGSLICGAWAPAITVLFNFSGWFWMRCLIAVSEWAATVPLAYVYVTAPTLAAILVYYAVVFGTVSGWLWTPRRRWFAVAGLAVWCGFLGFEWRRERTEFRLTCLPLRNAGVTFAQSPDPADNLLIDCGEATSAVSEVTPFLRAHGINRLAQLALTEGDASLMGGAADVERAFSVRQLVTSSVAFRSPTYRSALAAPVEGAKHRREIARGDRLGPWEVLHPDQTDRALQADDGALCLRGELNGARALYLGDLSRVGQRRLLERETNLRADLVITGLPRKDEPLIDEMLEAVHPRAIIVNAAKGSRKQEAWNQLRQRLAASGIPVWFTGDSGGLTILFRSTGWEIRAANHQRLLAVSAAPIPEPPPLNRPSTPQ